MALNKRELRKVDAPRISKITAIAKLIADKAFPKAGFGAETTFRARLPGTWNVICWTLPPRDNKAMTPKAKHKPSKTKSQNATLKILMDGKKIQ